MLIQQVRRTIDCHHLLERGDRVIVGVSAGIDSMVLLSLLHALSQEFGLSLFVAHVNHGLRPEASKKEAELVRKESERFGLPFEYGSFDVKEFRKVRGLSTQDAARKVRFHFFNDLLKKHGAQKIALGHHADDQVETFLLRLIRGSGLKGLKGMLPIREGRVIRPLLEAWREEIETFAAREEIPFLVDSSNLEKYYLRNKVRLSLIPLIEKEYQPNFKALVLRTTTLLREENDYLEREAEKIYQGMIRQEKEIFSFSFLRFRSLHQTLQWRILQKIFTEIQAEEGVMEEGKTGVANMAYRQLMQSPPSFLLELPGKISIEKRYDDVVIGKKEISLIPSFETEILSPGQTFVKEIGKRIVVEEMTREDWTGNLDKTSQAAFLDYQKLQFPLTVRNFRPGDRFQPFGVKGTQKLKEFFIDHKIPRFERPRIPLLVSGEKICWVGGYRIDDHFKVAEKTQKIIKVNVI